MVAHLLDEFHLLLPEAALPEVSEAGVRGGRAQGRQVHKGLVQVLLHEHSGSHSVLGFTPLVVARLLLFLEERAAAALVLHFQDARRPRASPRPIPGKVAHALQSGLVEIEAQSEVGVGGSRMHVAQVADVGLHLGGVILRNPGARG